MAARQIDEHIFEQLMQGDKPVLVDFWAPWCPDCVRITEVYDELAREYEGMMETVKVNIDDFKALARQEGVRRIPTLIFYRGGEAQGFTVEPPSKAAIEDFLGQYMPKPQKAQQDEHVYDMVIVGGGPAGYTAALYAARAGLDAVVVEKLSAGGQMAQTHQVDNYPGFEDGADGYELAAKMQKQAERFGAQTMMAEVNGLELKDDIKTIRTSEGELKARTVALAMGAGPRELGLSKEKELVGRGVAYCAACDGMFYRGKTVAVVGGGNSAAADALLLSRIAEKVIVIHRRDTLRATKVYHEPLMKAPNVEFRWDSVVEELLHGDVLTGLRIRNVKTGEESTVECAGVFVSIGRKPATEMLHGQVQLDDNNYVAADETTQTSLPGVYAIGDIRQKPLRQIVTAVADGATAVHMAEEYLAVHG